MVIYGMKIKEVLKDGQRNLREEETKRRVERTGEGGRGQYREGNGENREG